VQKGLGRGWVEFLQGRACSKYKRVREPLIAVLQEVACVAPRRLLLAAACAGRLVAQVRSAGLLRCSWCGLLVYRPAPSASTKGQHTGRLDLDAAVLLPVLDIN
jgi:hypothetical protein